LVLVRDTKIHGESSNHETIIVIGFLASLLLGADGIRRLDTSTEKSLQNVSIHEA
jgi:hypothetical protein